MSEPWKRPSQEAAAMDPSRFVYVDPLDDTTYYLTEFNSLDDVWRHRDYLNAMAARDEELAERGHCGDCGGDAMDGYPCIHGEIYSDGSCPSFTGTF